jgi:hypothetical protein
MEPIRVANVRMNAGCRASQIPLGFEQRPEDPIENSKWLTSFKRVFDEW